MQVARSPAINDKTAPVHRDVTVVPQYLLQSVQDYCTPDTSANRDVMYVVEYIEPILSLLLLPFP